MATAREDLQLQLATPGQKDRKQLLEYIEKGQIGYDATLQGPYGTRKVLYADYTASGKPLAFIENYLHSEVLSCYGNTHTTTSYTSRQTTYFREEARNILRKSLNCCDDDSVIFTGSGCTGAVHKLVHCLGLDRLDKPPVVFVSPFEHHSNLLPWMECASGAEVIRLSEDKYGELDFSDLEKKLKHYQSTGRQMIGALNAGSNITGVLTNTNAFSALLHKYNALAFWDYAAAAPYVKIDMNPPNNELAYKDGVYFSMHKFVGGPDSPGVLVAKHSLFRNSIPHVPGGGTVLFVTKEHHRYHADPEVREEGGTPAILGSIRAGLAIQLKEAVGTEWIMAREEELCRRVFREWEPVSELMVVGPHSVSRLPIFSFLIRHPASGMFLHHYFISALLNDLFGIQARGGCSCAGPYGQTLLDIDEELALKLVKSETDSDHNERELMKPGMTRLNFPYFMNETAVKYIIEAVKMVARDGWKLLPQYTLNPETGLFSHKDRPPQERRWLSDISYENGVMSFPMTTYQPAPSYEESLRAARKVFDDATTANTDPQSFRHHLPVLSKESEELRWFLMPDEAQEYLTGARTTSLASRSFQPKFYPKRSLKMRRLQAGGGGGGGGKVSSSSSSPEHHPAATAGVTGPHRGRVYKITPSTSPVPPELPDDRLSGGDISDHMGSFMAEVEPTAGEDSRMSLGRMVSIRLHVAEEAPVISQKDRQGEEGQLQQEKTATNFKRWVSTDALSVWRNDGNDSTTQHPVEGMLPSSGLITRSRGSIPNGLSNKEGKVGTRSNNISENGSVLNSKEAKGKRHHHAKKHWKIKRIFGIKN